MVEDGRLADRIWFRMVDDSKRSDTLGNKNQQVDSRSTAWKDAAAKAPEGVKSREREGGRTNPE